MKKFQFSENELGFIENSFMPIAFYQFVDKRVVTIALSKGFCELFGFEDKAEAYFLMDNDMYRDAHPDDVVRISEAAYDFAVNGGEYEVVYRNKSPKDSGYRVIHAQGRHQQTSTGDTLALIWYTDEGGYSEDRLQYSNKLNRLFNEFLYRESLVQTNTYDSLTGLPNIQYFFQLSEAGRDKLLEDNRQPAMIFFDLNDMTGFNSRYGYAEGDKLIKAFADLLVRYFSKENCGRFGQDHFIVYADDDGLKDNLNALFEECKSINGGKTRTVRAGIFLKIIGTTLDAGIACDRAKAAADSITDKNISAFRYFDKEMLAEINHRQYIIDNFDRAMEEEWIRVYYQPIVRASNGKVCDEEALSRWIDPVKGFLTPDKFIPILEEHHLTYKLTLYVLGRIINKIKQSDAAGMYIVPQSINLSRYDFTSCDIVEEIRRMVDDAGVSHDKITIEITESVIGSDFEFMKQQVERFRELGFSVWMDDFGSDYSSLDFLQSIPFDLIKLDMRFMKQFHDSEKTKIIITELVSMAMNLGLDTVAEGVEHQDQVEFLREIGCTKLQGFYYCKPIPPEEILERNKKGIQIDYENPDESGYYEDVGRINLYDISRMGQAESETLQQYFNTLPMAVLEIDSGDPESRYNILRSNKPFMEFSQSTRVKPTKSFVDAIRKCAKEKINFVIDEELEDGTILHTYLKNIAENKVRGVSAVAVAILAASNRSDKAASMSYATVARALSADYFNLFYVNLETENFVQYNTDKTYGELAVERHGSDFFSSSRRDAKSVLYKDDQKEFIKSFTKENVIKSLDRQGSFNLTYRQMIDGEPVYVSMKATRMENDTSHIIIGVNNIDVEMKHKAALEAIIQEQATYSRIKAITGEFLSFYTVDPETDSYIEYNATSVYEEMGFSKSGEDFFTESRKEAVRAVYPQDLDLFLSGFSKDKILSTIEREGVYVLQYRLMISGEPKYVHLTAGMSDGKIIIGVNVVDARVKQAQEYDRRIEELSRIPTEAMTTEEMRFQYIVDHTAKPAAILSVDKLADGGFGDIRIVRANRAYKETMGSGYYDNMLYHELVPKDIKFEDFCYNAAVLGRRMHSYVDTKQLDEWTDLELIPMISHNDNKGYCLFIFEFTKGPEAGRLSNVSLETSGIAIEACVKLLKTDDFKGSVKSVLEDILALAEAYSSRIVLVDHETGMVSNYCTALRGEEQAKGLPFDETQPYDLVKTWDSMVKDSNVVIIKDDHDMAYVEQKNPAWAESLRSFNIESLIFIPLYRGSDIFGYLYITNFNTEKVIAVKEVLELLSFFFGAEISKRLLIENMERSALTDSLTGANNRNAMIMSMKQNAGKPIGVICVDVNGMKKINSEYGSDEGDGYILRTYQSIRTVAFQEDIFRSGGDEFAVFLPGIRKDVFERRVQRLKNDPEYKDNKLYSIGTFWSDGCILPAEALTAAEDVLLESKKELYKME